MKILILSTAFSGMAQRLLGELQQSDHEIAEHYDLDENYLRFQVDNFQPDVIVCPYLTQVIPEDIWKNYLCLIVHPGIEGDRGPSSLDWAISEGADEWGVTLLQADKEMDAGDIWGTENFAMRSASKTSLFKREVTRTAINLIKKALEDIESGHINPRPLDYSLPTVKGRLRPLMRQDSRAIEWHKDSTQTILRKIQAADSQPGVTVTINDYQTKIFDAVEDYDLHGGSPGEIIAMYKNAFCCATIDGAVWFKHLLCKELDILPAIKLPACMVLRHILPMSQLNKIPLLPHCKAIEDIHVEYHGKTAKIYFNFYNGAMSTQQCLELKAELQKVKASEVSIIVFMGGEDFFSNGIHLNVIEASNDQAQESWHNINAINDLIFEIINSPNHVTIAALRNNAGAGGAIMALACDQVIIREGVVLNPHYQSMGLYGSEYWTYLLPARVGQSLAKDITSLCLPMLAQEAIDIGMVDLMFSEDWESYHDKLIQYCEEFEEAFNFEQFFNTKREILEDLSRSGQLLECRQQELKYMKASFYDKNSEYHKKRNAFVFKKKSENAHSISDYSDYKVSNQ